MLKKISSLSLVAVVALVGLSAAQSAQPNLAGTYRCGPDAKSCEWSGTMFTLTQVGSNLDIKNDKGAIGTATLTSNISLSAGPPWNMLGVLSGDNRVIDWSNGTQWRKQAPPS
jgi:hypothetical protein